MQGWTNLGFWCNPRQLGTLGIEDAFQKKAMANYFPIGLIRQGSIKSPEVKLESNEMNLLNLKEA